MIFQKSVDEILNELLAAHFNKSGKTPGALIRMIYTSFASVAWGIYRLGLFITRQIVPSGETDSAWIIKHARMRGLTPISGESDADLLDRISDDINYPVAGGNKKDWERWVREYSYTHYPGQGSAEWTEAATLVKVVDGTDARGTGSINIAIITNNADLYQVGIATDAYLQGLTVYLNALRPLGIWDFVAYASPHLVVAVTLEIEAVDYVAVKALIEQRLPAFILSLIPGQRLLLSSIIALAKECDATDVTVASPTGNVEPDNGPTSYERCYPGTITISRMT